MKDTKTLTIRCPHCEWEYLPGEIYYPKHFLGQPKDIERTVEGNIDVYNGIEQNLEEVFYCEHCGKPFRVHAKVEYNVEKAVELDFDSDYKTPLYIDRLNLKEE